MTNDRREGNAEEHSYSLLLCVTPAQPSAKLITLAAGTNENIYFTAGMKAQCRMHGISPKGISRQACDKVDHPDVPRNRVHFLTDDAVRNPKQRPSNTLTSFIN